MNLKPKRIVITTLALVVLTSAGLVFYPTLDPNEITESKLLRTLQQDQTKVLHEDVHYAVFPSGTISRIEQRTIIGKSTTKALYKSLMGLSPYKTQPISTPGRIPNAQFASIGPDKGLVFYQNSAAGFTRYVNIRFASDPNAPAIVMLNYTKKVSQAELLLARLTGKKVYNITLFSRSVRSSAP